MDELFKRLSFIEHVKEGLKDIEEGRVFSQEELEIEKW